MASSTALPNELVVFVINGLDRVQDLAALALTNRHLYSLANVHLYKRAAQCDDARPLAWAANRGILSTLRMALAAGADPNAELVEFISTGEWEAVTATARADATAGREKTPWAMWEVNNRPWNAQGQVTAASGTHNGGVHGHNQGERGSTPSSTATTIAPSPQPASTSDQDSVVSSEEDLSEREDATPATERSPTPTPCMLARRYRAIHLAARSGHDDVLELLLRHGALVDAPSERFCACTQQYGLLNMLESPDPDAQNPLWTPLHAAICHRHTSTAKLLLAHKASPMMEPLPSLEIPGFVAAYATSPEPIHFGASALHHAAAFGLTELVTYLHTTARILPDIDILQDKNYLTPFYYAVANRRWSSTVPQLLQLGANIHCEIRMYIPYTAITPLGEACRLGHFPIADRLLALGADPSRGFIALTSGGCLTPLHMCCMRSAQAVGEPRENGDDDEERGKARMATMEKLVKGGAKTDAMDCFGDTPLSAAEKAQNVFALEALERLSLEDKEVEHTPEGKEGKVGGLLS
ncbi:ankyrin repeat-containing domain protein [Dichotomopilus funicola]|uniref:Ankyrin repeat-containing domain protein n=1 Tax=Dichotomopilus funicola TaxID=1934379 RepID=A0AAN6V0F5_9PEZI|nr:ankyrin repeat-containing domain protein [Dichotomopilus funicola]